MNFKIGFYNELDELKSVDPEANFGFLENVDVTPDKTARDFLHGSCDEFAAMLSDTFGYDIECVRNANHRLIHAYCVGFIGDEKAYIDIRGITTDKNLFFKEFDRELFYYAPQDTILVEDDEGYELEAEVEVWHSKDELFDGDYEDWVDPDIRDFVLDNVSYFDTDKLESVYICTECSAEFVASDEDHDWFGYYGEEGLWGHLQLEHPETFEKCQTMETPEMLEVYYKHVIRSAPAKKSLPDLSEMIGAAEQRSQHLEVLYKDSGREVEAR